MSQAVKAISQISRALNNERVRRACVDWTQVFANLCVPISILVGILVFSTQRNDQKVQLDAQLNAQMMQDRRSAAMQFVMLKHQDSFLNPVGKITAAFAQPGVIESLRYLSGDERKQLIAKQSNAAGLDNFATMSDLYRAVIACRDSKSCDAEILDAAYRTEITQFYCLSKDYALPQLAIKLNDPDYGVPIARYAQQCRG